MACYFDRLWHGLLQARLHGRAHATLCLASRNPSRSLVVKTNHHSLNTYAAPCGFPGQLSSPVLNCHGSLAPSPDQVSMYTTNQGSFDLNNPRSRSFSSDGTSQRTISQGKKDRDKSLFTISDPLCADRIVAELQNHMDLSDPELVLLESHAGHGVLTSALLQMGGQSLLVYEPRAVYWPALQDLMETFDERMVLYRSNPLRQSTVQHLIGPLASGPAQDEHVKDSFSRGWNEECKLKIIGTLSGNLASYVVRLAYDISAQDYVYSSGRAEHFIIVDSSEVQLLQNNGLFVRACLRSALYKILFDTQVCLEIPITASELRTSKIKRMQASAENLYLLRLAPKADLLTAVCSAERIHGLVNLLKELRSKKSQRLILIMEQWCPGIGETLIYNGFGMLDRVQDLQPQQIVQLYKLMLDYPGYEKCALRSHIEKDILHTEDSKETSEEREGLNL